MAEKIPLRRKIFYLLIPLLILLTGVWQCRPDFEETEAVRLESFLVGVVRTARRRYQVKDIKIGEVSVLSLFQEYPLENSFDPGWSPGGYFGCKEMRLIVEGGNEWEELKQILIAHRDQPVDVIMRDEWNPLGRKEPYEYRIRIPVTVTTTPCDEVTRLVYDRVISKVIKEENKDSLTKTGQTDKHLDINEVFDKLRADKEIEAYIDKLDSITDAPCVTTIRLLKSDQEQKTTGFGSGKYVLSKKIQEGLNLIIATLATTSDWWRSELSVRITGFTDEVEVTDLSDKKLAITAAGISADAWRRINNQFEVFYSGCDKNRLNDQPIYLGFPQSRGEQEVGSQIDNNCELGAVRAYVALVYLTSKLDRDNADYSYATGGIYSGPDAGTEPDDAEKRRVHVEFIMRAAKVDVPNRN